MTAEEWELLVKFDTDNPEFVRGFECGQVWAELRAMPGPSGDYRRLVRVSNEIMLRRIAGACGFAAEFTDSDIGWTDMALVRDSDMPMRPNLLLVKEGEADA